MKPRSFSLQYKEKFFIAILSLFVVLFYWFSLRKGQDYIIGDVFCYLQFARNLLEGRPFYAFDILQSSPEGLHTLPFQGPPPGFSFLLAPFMALWNGDIEHLKWIITFCWIIALWFIYLSLRYVTSPAIALWTTTLTALNPFVWINKEVIMSDIPFLMFLSIALFLTLKIFSYVFQSSHQLSPWWIVLWSLSLFAVLFTRTIGIALLSVYGIVLWRWRSIKQHRWLLILLPPLIIITLWWLLDKTFDISSSKQLQNTYLPMLLDHWKNAFHKDYFLSFWIAKARKLLGMLLHWGLFIGREKVTWGTKLFWIALWIATLYVLIKYKIIFYPRWQIIFLFFFAYYGTIWLWVVGLARFILPILPLTLLFLTHAIAKVFRSNPYWRIALWSSLLLFYAIKYFQLTTKWQWEFSRSYHEKSTQEMLAIVKHHTTPKDRCVFYVPTFLTYFTRRPSMPPIPPKHCKNLYTCYQTYLKHQVKLWIIEKKPKMENEPLYNFLQQCLKKGWIKKLFENQHFLIYKPLLLPPKRKPS